MTPYDLVGKNIMCVIETTLYNRISKLKTNLFFRFGVLAAKTAELPAIWDKTP